MIFVLDGPDGVGKTTLAKRLAERTSGKYLHLTYRWKDKIHLYHDAAIRYAARLQPQTVVIDRWWPSEAVYAKAYRGGSQWPLYGRLADRIALKFGVMYIYCLPDSVDEAVKRHAKLKGEREEMYDDIAEVADLYLKLWHGDKRHEDKGNYIDQLILNGGLSGNWNCAYYSIGKWGHAMDLFIEHVIGAGLQWMEAQYAPALLYDEWNVSGHLAEAKYLFVGEQVNPKYREMYWPFHEYGNSSLFLTQALHEINYNERWGMWVNAFNHDGSLNQHLEMIALSKKLRIITLGNKAAAAVAKLGLPIHSAVPHPSYAKRFQKVDLVEIFKHAICE